MPFVVKDRVKVTSTTTGTGTFTLGAAAAGFQDFSAVVPNSEWNVSTATYTQSFSVAAQEANPNGVFFKPDGTKMYISGTTGDDINEYNLSVPWDITTATYLQNFSVAAQETNPQDVFFKSDGTKMYVIGTVGASVYEYDLSSAWNISTASYLQSFSVSAQELTPFGLFIGSNGTKMYVVGNSTDTVYEYDLSSAWDISTAVYLQSFSVAAQDSVPVAVFFKSDGTEMYVLGGTNEFVYQYGLSSAWNITTATLKQSVHVLSQDSSMQGMFIRPDGYQMFLIGSINDRVYAYQLGYNQTYYTITDGTDWEIGIGYVYDGGTTLSRDTILESSNSNNAVNWGAGDKDVFCTYPADATEGTVPTADNSSVGTDLVAWTNLKKELDAGVLNGVPYANGNVSGMVSTYSLVYTSGAYGLQYGGVLAPNGDIYFIPSYNANRGQKISATGVVSTYSLAYTATSQLWKGGVLAANGDIHFIPYDANLGQKISASGVVSTYSLVYTASSAYAGGVLAPNGDIHFIPNNANRGQKISASGVVSTYSLVYVASGAYWGGVLAPNGDIHFVPSFNCPVGQKVSSAGVVSTYSLVYTSPDNAYRGGVLAANGDIHFVPYQANRGQKISESGVISTYSLVYTASGAYQGGVLAPNGDIHFIASNANRGQKVSEINVVSTYSLVRTEAGGAYAGGVLAPNGEIHFVPEYSTQGQKISTNTPKNIGYCLSPFFNKF